LLKGHLHLRFVLVKYLQKRGENFSDLFEVSSGLELAVDEVVEEHQGRLPELNFRYQGQLQEGANHAWIKQVRFLYMGSFIYLFGVKTIFGGKILFGGRILFGRKNII
jgi:hypothetical protein